MSAKESFYLEASRGLCDIIDGIVEVYEKCGVLSEGYIASLKAYVPVCRSRLAEVSELKGGV